MSLEGTKVLITGGGRGIGARVAEFLAERGCWIALCDRLEKELEETASRIATKCEVPVQPYVCDVTDPDRVREMIAEIVEWAGGLNVLVNNAGVLGPTIPFEDVALEDWRTPIDTNLFGTVHCTHAVLPWMMKQGHGKIINYAGGGVGWKDIKFERLHTSYVTSKYAVYGFTEVLAHAMVDSNIQVNIISPGKVETALWDGVSPERREELRQSARRPEWHQRSPSDSVSCLGVFGRPHRQYPECRLGRHRRIGARRRGHKQLLPQYHSQDRQQELFFPLNDLG